MFKKIAIIGVGLIGGSIGLAAKKKKLAKEIVGVCRRESSRKKALKFKAVGKATLNLKEAVRDADIVIIASPIGKIVRLAGACIKSMKKGAILTDVGSSKDHIVGKIEKLAKGKIHFIGSHPMAGSDKAGVQNATSDLFDNAMVIVTKTKNTNSVSLTRLNKFWKALKCHTLMLSPAKHDALASLASYLPHVVSYALSASQTNDSSRISAGSLRDTTRVASSDPELWSDIFLSSRKETLKAINVFLKNIRMLEKAIRRRDRVAIKTFLARANRIRNRIK
ncbi:MAG: prephenate dehydrogenase/arogenate dehydrogenase family protein [Candidatus Omnitrophica bacterium]|nr:prephenate dehydrogenase/arogenate dehydrogenase family protein [Candidatus Omnitrophota bacterium]